MNPTTPEEFNDIDSIEYVGRAVAALAADPYVMEKTGRILEARLLGPEYGFTDIDGGQPPDWRESQRSG